MSSTADEQQKTAAPEEAITEDDRLEKAASEETASEEAASDGGPAEQVAESSGEAAEEQAAPEEGANSELEALRTELREREEEREMLNDRLLRTAAELQNVRRRAAEEQRRRAASARAGAVRPMLEVMDDIERTLAAAEDQQETQDAEAAFQSLHDGVAMVADKLRRALSNLGVEPIEAEGQPFDENEHEAMLQRPAPEGVEPGTVLDEVRTGYRMTTSEDDDRILRHSRVVVASAPAEEADAGEDAEESEDAEE